MDDLTGEIKQLANPKKANELMRFFKTGVGEYGEGDKFLGIIVPYQRKLVKKYYTKLTLNDVVSLLQNPFHEYRLIALLMFVAKYKHANTLEKEKIVSLYLKNTKYINNWDLVDLSARDIIGAHFFEKDKTLLYRLAKSSSLWERRISIISTSYFIGRNQFEDTLKIAKILLNDSHDLIHKAVGWMLREVGKRDETVEEDFLKLHYKKMPRTCLRYAIERFAESKRQSYLKR